jgi:hypothetical protein
MALTIVGTLATIVGAITGVWMCCTGQCPCCRRAPSDAFMVVAPCCTRDTTINVGPAVNTGRELVPSDTGSRASVGEEPTPARRVAPGAVTNIRDRLETQV